MGLDNHILLRTRKQIDKDDLEEWPEYISIEHDDFWDNEYKDGYYYSICYWRKCWGLRDAILSLLEIDNSGGGKFTIDTPNQINGVINAIEFFLENPYEWKSQVWTIDEMAHILAKDIINLSWLKQFMNEHKDTKVIFIDSF